MTTAAAATHEADRRRSLARWWAGAERAEADACPAPDCEGFGKTAFDIYCDNGHLMLFADQPTMQRIVVNAARVAVALLAAITATRQSSWPLYLIAAGIGFAAIVLPLRRLPVARLVAGLGWVVSIGIAAGLREDIVTERTARQLALFLVLALVGAAVAAIFLDADGGAEDAVARAIGASGVGGLGLMVAGAVLSTAPGESVVRSSASVRSLLLYAGALAAVGAVSAAAACGIVRGVRTANYDIGTFIEKPHRRVAPQLPRRPVPQRPAGGFGPQVVFIVHVFAARIIRYIADGLNLALRVIWASVYLVSLFVIRAVNSVCTFVVRILMAVASAAAQTARLLANSVMGILRPLRVWLRKVAGTTIALIAAALLAVFASDRFADYLVSGSLSDVASALIAAALFPLALGSIWWTVTSAQFNVIRASAGELLADAGPYAFLTLLAIGWALGIAGWFGIGEIRPGVLTYLGTALVAVAALYTYIRSDARADPAQ